MPIAPLHNERILLIEVAAGNEVSYTEIFHHYAPDVFNAAMVYLKDDTQANEIVQDVFMKVWQKRETMQDIANFRNYLFILARNRIYDGFKKKAVEQIALDHYHYTARHAVNENTDHRVQDKQYEQVLQSAIELLTPARKNVYLARSDGKSYEEIAAELNISVNTAKKQMTQAKQFVQEYIMQYLHIYALLLANGHHLLEFLPFKR